mgnify:CR=1 FL=1
MFWACAKKWHRAIRFKSSPRKKTGAAGFPLLSLTQEKVRIKFRVFDLPTFKVNFTTFINLN